MPKIYSQTRRYKAEKLLELIEKGPAIITHPAMYPSERFTPDQMKRLQESYQLWFNSWVRQPIIELIPELRKKHEEELRKIHEQNIG